MTTTSAIPIVIGGTLIEFPNTGASSQWSPAIIQFAEAVAAALASHGNVYDIAPTVQTLTNNLNTGIWLNGNGSNLAFPSTAVRSFTLNYAIFRNTQSVGAMNESSSGIVEGVYNTITSTWALEHSFQGDTQSDGSPWCTFSIDSSDRILFSSAVLPTGVYPGTELSTISYSATTQLVHI